MNGLGLLILDVCWCFRAVWGCNVNSGCSREDFIDIYRLFKMELSLICDHFIGNYRVLRL